MLTRDSRSDAVLNACASVTSYSVLALWGMVHHFSQECNSIEMDVSVCVRFPTSSNVWQICALITLLLGKTHGLPFLSPLSVVKMWYDGYDSGREMLDPNKASSRMGATGSTCQGAVHGNEGEVLGIGFGGRKDLTRRQSPVK